MNPARASARLEPPRDVPSPASAPDLRVWAPLAIEAWTLRSGDPRLRVERCGMGPDRARATARRAGASPRAALAVAGLCGALDPALAPGSVFAPSELHTPEGEVFRADAEGLCRALAARGIAAERGALLGTDHLVSGAERAELAASGARAVDMESPWLAAAAAGRPFAVLRVVVDAPGHELKSPSLLRSGWRALAALRAAAPALLDWARQSTPSLAFCEAPPSTR